MQTPYQILDIAVNASDTEIKQAYLQQVKINPPDRDQQKFQVIHDAYSAIKDHKSRVSHDLFTLPTGNFKHLIDQALQTEQTVELGANGLKKILSSIDELSLLNVFTTSKK